MEIKYIPQLGDMIFTELFGWMPDKTEIFTYRLTNAKGMELHMINYGATVTAIKIPLQNGKKVDVVLGFDSLENYVESFNLPAAPYFGTTVGRFAGRIANALFELNGKQYKLHANNNLNSLHGGVKGFSQAVWNAELGNTPEGPSVTFSYISADNEEGFPGKLEVKVTYTLTENNEVKIKYHAIADADTVINLTHHSYFNLDGQQDSILNQELFVDADFILETDSEHIPTGRFLSLHEHRLEFNPAKKCPNTIDNTFILTQKTPIVASLVGAKNPIKMQVFTDQPGLHIYVGGNCFNQLQGKEKANYHLNSGICFEAQNFPDAPNQAHFPTTVLKKGEHYTQQTIYKFENI